MRSAALLALLLAVSALAAPPDPGTTPKTPGDLGGDQAKIKAYVDSVYEYGLYLFNRNDVAGARRYWSIIKTHYAGASDKVRMIDAWLAKAKSEGLLDEKGEVTPPGPTFDRGKGPLFGRSAVEEDDEEVPDGPPGGGSSTGGGSSNVARKTARIVRAREAAQARKSLRLELSLGTSKTRAGAFQHIQLALTIGQPVKYLSVVWNAYSEKGKVFRHVRTYRSPATRKRHLTLALYDRRWQGKYGKCIAARVDVYHGPRDDRIFIGARQVHHRKALPNWWKSRYRGRLGFFEHKQSPFESHTLTPVSRRYWSDEEEKAARKSWTGPTSRPGLGLTRARRYFRPAAAIAQRKP